MALYQDIYGWETGADYGIALSGASAAAAYISDGTANTGCYYGKALLKTSGGNLFTRSFSPSISVSGNSTGTGFEIKAGFYLRVATYPDQNGTAIAALGNGAGGTATDFALRLNTDGTWGIYNDFLVGATSAGTGTILLNTWYYCTISFRWERQWGTNPTKDHVVMAANIAGIGGASFDQLFSNLIGNAITANRIELGSKTLFNASGSVTVGESHYDDLAILMGNITDGGTVTVGSLPASTRVRLVRAESQGSSADWTGSYTDLQEIPLNTSGPGQTSTVAGKTTTFGHSTWDQFNFGAVDAVKCYAFCQANVVGPLTENIKLNGTSYPITSITSGYLNGVSSPVAVDWSSYPKAQFDAMEFGFINSTGNNLTLGAIHLEVLYTPGADAWTGCNAPGGTDPSFSANPGCVDTFPVGSSSGGSGCTDAFTIGSSSGGTGCVV